MARGSWPAGWRPRGDAAAGRRRGPRRRALRLRCRRQGRRSLRTWRRAWEPGSSGSPAAARGFYYPEMAGAGGALFDYDGDGWLDVYLVQGAPLPGYHEKAGAPLRNRLYRSLEGRRFVDVTAQAGVDGRREGKKVYGLGCAIGDIDNDGDPDLFVSGVGGCLLYRNNGRGGFEEISRASGIRDPNCGTSAALFDYDTDGLLDLVVCEYVTYHWGEDGKCLTPDKKRDYCRPGAYAPSRSRLYHNLGNARFQDVTAAAGLTRLGKALGVVAGDVDGDQKPDIYLACDLTPNLLYLNQGGGKFHEEAVARGCALGENGQAQSGMGVDLADLDGDLLPDLWVTNYYRENNNLFHNLGGGVFTDVASAAAPGGVNRHQVCFGTGLVDVNNDGWRDVFVTNGHVLRYPEKETPGADRAQADQLFLNLGQGAFRECLRRSGTMVQEQARGARRGVRRHRQRRRSRYSARPQRGPGRRAAERGRQPGELASVCVSRDD